MWWMISAMAGVAQVEVSPVSGPVARMWAAGGDCDAGPLIRAAGRLVVDGHDLEPVARVLANAEPLARWREARRCGWWSREAPLTHVFDVYRLSQVAQAEADLLLEHSPDAGASASVEVLELGLDASLAGVVGGMVSNAVWLTGLESLEAHWQDLPPATRVEVAEDVRWLWERRPELDLVGERAHIRALAASDEVSLWVPPGWCIAAADAAIDSVEQALAAPQPLTVLDAPEPTSITRILGGQCGTSLHPVAADWYREQQAIEARIMALEADGGR